MTPYELLALCVSLLSAGIVAIALRRTYAAKALDLRIELGRSHNDLDLLMRGLATFLDYVRQSHIRVLAATGRNDSGEMQIFEESSKRTNTDFRLSKGNCHVFPRAMRRTLHSSSRLICWTCTDARAKRGPCTRNTTRPETQMKCAATRFARGTKLPR